MVAAVVAASLRLVVSVDKNGSQHPGGDHVSEIRRQSKRASIGRLPAIPNSVACNEVNFSLLHRSGCCHNGACGDSA